MKRRLALVAVSASFWLLIAGAVHAAPDEIQVYDDEINEPGEFGVELHSNYVFSGEKVAEYPGQLPPHHVLQLVPEFSYGLTNSLEAGLYVPTLAVTQDGEVLGNGLRVRLKYMGQPEGQKYFWGLNGELGYMVQRVSPYRYHFELRPIFGARGDGWLLAFNPILAFSLSDGAKRTPEFEPGVKISRQISDHLGVGIEHYANLGHVDRFERAKDQGHMLFLVVDGTRGTSMLNFGLGHGLTSGTADRWVAKLIASVEWW